MHIDIAPFIPLPSQKNNKTIPNKCRTNMLFAAPLQHLGFRVWICCSGDQLFIILGELIALSLRSSISALLLGAA